MKKHRFKNFTRDRKRQSGVALVLSVMLSFVLIMMIAAAVSITTLSISLEQQFKNAQLAAEAALRRFAPAECINWPGGTNYKTTLDTNANGIADGVEACARTRYALAYSRNYPSNAAGTNACPSVSTPTEAQMTTCLTSGLNAGERLGSIISAVNAVTDVTTSNRYVGNMSVAQTYTTVYDPTSVSISPDKLILGHCSINASSTTATDLNLRTYTCYLINNNTVINADGQTLRFPYTMNYVNAVRVQLQSKNSTGQAISTFLGGFLGTKFFELKNGIGIAHFDPTRAWQCEGYTNIYPYQLLQNSVTTWSAAAGNTFTATPPPPPPTCQPKLPPNP